jgi:DNA-binding NarL/FixJ family response regulator
MTQLGAKRTLPTSDNSSSSVQITASQNLRSFSSGKPLTIALIDSGSLTREGLMRLLEDAEILSLLPLSRCSELLEKGSEVLSEVEIILLNIGSTVIGNSEGFRDIALLNEALPNTPIIVIGDREDSLQVGQALHQGARGYITTTSTSQILMGALRLVQAGGTFVPPGAFTEALSQRQPIAPEAEVGALNLCGLTPRQREVLNLLRKGKPNKTIAHELGICESTVKVHVRSIIRKMGVTNRTEVSFRFYRHELTLPPDPGPVGSSVMRR